MKTRKDQTWKDNVSILRLGERRYAVAVDGVVRYVGTQEECQRLVDILAGDTDRVAQDQALARLGRVMR